MAKGIYVGVSNKARKIKNVYIGVDGVARKVKKAYIGVNGVAKLFYELDEIRPYLTFSSDGSFTLATYNTTKNWDGTLEYSTDAINWSEWDGTTTLSSGIFDKIYLRGIGNTKITGSSLNYRWVLTGSNIECIGNIENLLDYQTVSNGEHPAMANYCYNGMFYDSSNLTTPPELPAITLSTYCYRYMFCDCSNLTTTPELPATTLSTYCYCYMFQNCKNLVTPPKLHATILASNCYYGMFYGCSNLLTTPELPATTLATYCYMNMFRNCKKITTLPILPATTLLNYCYQNMFNGCTNIKISETQTSEYIYEWRIPTSGTATASTSSLTDMLTDTGGTFAETPIINTTYYTTNEPI